MIKRFLSVSILLLTFHAAAQTFPGAGGPIDDMETYEYSATVSGLQNTINTSDFGLERVCINVEHSWDADVTIQLVAPDGTTATLITDTGGDGDDMQTTCFQWDALASITQGSPPFNGTFKPIEEMGIVNNGQNPNGVWKLRVSDSYWGDEGDLLNWSITFSANPASYFQLTESNLPIVVIQTANSQGIPDDPKIDAHMGIIYNGVGQINHIDDPYNNYNNNIGIEQRGSSSAGFPQKSYGFETRDVNGTTHDTVLLGMPEENDWILYAPYDDKTCMRNILSYDIANKTGHYASRTQLCELVLNGQYKGIYVLMEKIKRDDNRVNISKLQPTDIDGDEVTGGYIIKVDRNDGPGSYWSSNYPASSGSTVNFVHVEPEADEIVPQQREYIEDYMDAFETALAGPNFADPLTGYRQYIDVQSFIDYFLLNEISKNVDGYRLSTFLYKDKQTEGGKLTAGPAWDYNLAWWNADYCEGWLETGWAYAFNDICGGGDNDVPFWWARLLEDPAFQSDLKCRWTELRQTTLDIPTLYGVIDSVAAYVNEAKDRHFYTWPILGVYTWPNPSPIPDNYPEEIQALKHWIDIRFTWLDDHIPGICYLSTDALALQEQQVNAWPNPFDTGFDVRFYLPEDQQLEIRLTNALGQTVKTVGQTQFQAGENLFSIDVSQEQLTDGLYLLEIRSGSSTVVKKLLKGTR